MLLKEIVELHHHTDQYRHGVTCTRCWHKFHEPLFKWKWIRGTAANDPMASIEAVESPVPNSSNFTTIKLPTGETTAVTYSGSVFISLNLKLNNVLNVPKIKFNLLYIYISKFTIRNNCFVSFYPYFCIFSSYILKMWWTWRVKHGRITLLLIQENQLLTLQIPLFFLINFS